MFKLIIILISVYGSVANRHVFDVHLDPRAQITYYWSPEYETQTLRTELHVPTGFSWFAVGFSNRGELFPSDLCVIWTDFKGQINFDDAYTDDQGVIYVDPQQDCLNFKTVTRSGITKFAFERAFDTCDDDDYIIEDGTTHIVWARGAEPLVKLTGLNISTPDTGMVRVQLLKTLSEEIRLPDDIQVLEIRANNVQVPNDETTYWCHVHRLPEELFQKHHVLQFEPVIQAGNEGLVHHMEVFHCIAPTTEDIPMYVGSCFAEDRPKETMVCKRVLAAWAMGAVAFQYPEEAGLPIGGPDFNPYLMLEVHYNNPEKRADYVDSSGVRFLITPNLRPMDAGVIELGLEYTDKMAIPPGQEEFSLTGYCVTECTAVSIPPEGIEIFGSQLHTHLTGVRVTTRHIRDGIEMPELNRDDHYSTHFQEIRKLKRRVRVLPGDALLTTCDYRTIDKDNVTLGGFSISDEMCVNYVHYFPASPLEVCKSSISDQGLSTYFRFMNEWEGQGTSQNLGISENYKSIKWNPLRAQFLENLYHEAPLSMQCNMSSGDRFPGYWENTPVTTILTPLPPPVRDCKNTAE